MLEESHSHITPSSVSVLLTITHTSTPATDVGFLLHKNPANVHRETLPFGEAHVFYPEAKDERCTAALLVTVNPVELVRGRPNSRRPQRQLEDYVNDRPYAASSFACVAMSRVFGTALAGRSKHRPELVRTPLCLEAELPVVQAGGGTAVLERLFLPLGYTIDATALPLDEKYPG